MATIDKLQSLYKQFDQHASAGEDVVADLRKEINNLELAYLKEDVLPRVAALLGSKIKNLRCGIDCSIQFDEDGVINYSFCTTGSMLMVKDSLDAKSCIEPTFAHSVDQTKNIETIVDEPISKVSISNVRIVDYSEKAIAVYGDTRQFADTFKDLGGYFNARLKEGPGWVFSKKRRYEIENLLAPYLSTSTNIPNEDNLFTQSGVEIGYPLSEEDWIKLISNMNCSTNKGIRAPHKAIFILAILDNIRKGYIKDKRIYPTVNLADSFRRIWNKYVPANWPFAANMYQPFVHLSSERFYSLELVSQRAKYDFNQSWNRTQILRYFRYGILDESLFNLFKSKSFASKVESSLLSIYLSNSQKPIQYKTVIRKEISSNFDDFQIYLGTLTSKTGKPYSESSIKLYANSLRGGYVRSIIAQYTPTENIDDISSIDTLRDIYRKVDSDSLLGVTNRSVALAVKMYLDYRSRNIAVETSSTAASTDNEDDGIYPGAQRKSKPLEIVSIDTVSKSVSEIEY